jgi:hypothetical protein
MLKASKRWQCEGCDTTINAGDEFTIVYGSIVCKTCSGGLWKTGTKNNLRPTEGVKALVKKPVKVLTRRKV